MLNDQRLQREPTVERLHHLINGCAGDGTSGNVGPVYNQATGRQVGEVDLASLEETDAAVAAAVAAFPAWRATSLAARTKLMYRFRELVDTNRAEIARRISAQHGKTLPDADGEVARGLENIEFAAGVATATAGRFTEQASTGVVDVGVLAEHTVGLVRDDQIVDFDGVADDLR